MHILSEEFSRQASMEDELQIPSALMAPPKKDIGSLAKAQLGFMNLFAIPLFQGVADIMPGMKYTVDELDINKGHFERMVEEEKMKELQDQQIITREGTLSPRSMSVAVGSGADDETPQAELRQEPSVKEETTEEAQHHDVPSPHLRGGEGDATAAPATTEGGNSGNMSSFDAVLQLANSDPFNSNSTGGLVGADGAQRRSETTEGSLSAGLAGDWASQATSAHTGRAPVSPSTQGTSIVSRESTTEDPSARSAPTTAATVPGCTVTEATPEGTPRALAADSSLAAAPAGHAGHAAGSSPSSTMRHQHFDEGSNSTGTNDVDSTTTGSLGSKNLRKKPSRFRIKDFNFFKRSKASSSPRPADSSASTS